MALAWHPAGRRTTRREAGSVSWPVLGLALALVGCGDPQWRLDIDNPYSPCPLRVLHGSTPIAEDSRPAWEAPARLPELSNEQLESTLRLSVQSPDGWTTVPTSAVRRITGDSIAVHPAMIGRPVIRLCIDNRGGPATELHIGQLSLPVPADAPMAVLGMLPPRDAATATLRLGERVLGDLPLAATLGKTQVVYVIDVTERRRYQARYNRYGTSSEGRPPILDFDPQGQRWVASAMHRVRFTHAKSDVTGLDSVDCLTPSPEQKREQGNRVQITEIVGS